MHCRRGAGQRTVKITFVRCAASGTLHSVTCRTLMQFCHESRSSPLNLHRTGSVDSGLGNEGESAPSECPAIVEHENACVPPAHRVLPHIGAIYAVAQTAHIPILFCFSNFPSRFFDPPHTIFHAEGAFADIFSDFFDCQAPSSRGRRVHSIFP